MKERNTKQKEIILDVLKNNNIHPTIYEICDLVKKIDSSIGQATVYRNIKKFVSDGILYVIKTKSGIDRYDYYNGRAHFECLKCGSIADIYDDKLFEYIDNSLKNKGINIINYNLLIDGYCDKCNK